MFGILLKTRLRKKLFTYSFTHPEGSYYVRELAAFIKEDPGNLSRELRRLEGEGIYRSRVRGRLKLFTLNREYPLFNEISKIVFKTEGIEGSLRGIVGKYKGITLSFIYGSYASQKEKPDSDVDLVVVGAMDRGKFLSEVRDLERKLGREINFTSYTPEEFDSERAKKGSFLALVLKSKHIVLKDERKTA